MTGDKGNKMFVPDQLGEVADYTREYHPAVIISETFHAAMPIENQNGQYFAHGQLGDSCAVAHECTVLSFAHTYFYDFSPIISVDVQPVSKSLVDMMLM